MNLRPGAQRAEVYNEGLAVYLHDPAHATAILAANPTSILDGGDLEPARDKALKQVVAEGWLVTYTLRQDDPLLVDVLVGAPLSKAELKALGVPLLKPTQTVISLPSGRLRLDSANTCRLLAEAQAAAAAHAAAHGQPPADDDLAGFGLEEASGEVAVPPGNYVLTLYRVDLEELPDDDEYDGPGEIIVLTPAAELPPPKKIPPVLEYGAGYARVAGLRSCRVVEGAFTGRALGGTLLNFGWPHAAALGLRRGQALRLTLAGREQRAVYLAGCDPSGDAPLCELLYPDRLKGFREAQRGVLTAAFVQDPELPRPLLSLGTLQLGTFLTVEPGAVRLEPLPEFLLPPPASEPVPSGAVADGVARGTVLASGAAGLELGCARAVLGALTRQTVADLRLTVGTVTVPLVLVPTPAQLGRSAHIVGSLAKDDAALFEYVFTQLAGGGDGVFWALVGSAAAPELRTVLAAYEAGCTFSSRDGYVPRDTALAAEQQAHTVALWREGVGRYAVPGALEGALRAHWDDPAAMRLSCRPIGYPPDNVLAGQEFELMVAG